MPLHEENRSDRRLEAHHVLPAESDRELIGRLRKIARFAAAVPIALGTMALIGWLHDIAALKSIVVGWPTMKANTALGCILAGLALLALSGESGQRARRAIATLCALSFAALGFLTLSQDLLGWNFGLDELLVTEQAGAVGAADAARMAPSSAAILVLLGIAMIFIAYRTRRSRAAEYIGVVVLALASLVFLGHLYGAHALYALGLDNTMALPTSLAFMILSAGTLAAVGPRGWMAFVVGPTNGGRMLRHLWIPGICILPLLAWLTLLGGNAGLYGWEFGFALAVTLAIFVLTFLTWRYARHVEQAGSAQRHAEAELRANEERLRLAMESAGLCTWDVDLRTGEAVWSENRFRLFGYPVAAGGRTSMEMWRKRVHPDDLPAVEAALEKARREGSLYAPDHRIVRADDGRIVWLRSAGRFHYDEAGRAVRFAGVTFDDTPRKKAELALRESERREREGAAELKALLEAVPAIVWIAHDRDCTRITGNRAANALLRLQEGAEASLSAVTGRPAHFKVMKEGRELSVDELPVQRAARGFAVHDFEETVVFTDGTIRHLLGNAETLWNENGEPRGAVAAFIDVTERKQAEEALRVSEKRFRSYFELGLIGMAITSADKRFLEVNDELCRVLGYERSELLRKTWPDIAHPDDAKSVTQFTPAMAGEIDGYSLEKRFIRKDGSTVFATISVTGVRRPDGTVDHFVCLIQDVTERKRAEDAVRESERRLSYALEASTEGLWDWNIQTGTVHYSPYWIQSLGYAPGEVPWHVSFWQGILHPEDVAAVRAALEAHFQGRTPAYECENRLMMKSGEYRWNLDRGRVVEWDADGTPLRMVGTGSDISARKLAEQAQAQLAAIVESNSDAIISRGLDRTILSWNPAAEKLFGWTAAEAVGQSIRITTPPEVWGTRDAIIERVAHGERVDPVQTVRVRKDGTRFVSETVYSPVKDAHGKVVSIATLVRDITERKRAEEALRDYAQRLEMVSRKLIEVRERERALVARELHERIGALLGAAQLALQAVRRRVASAALQEEIDESLHSIEKAMAETRTLSFELRPPQLEDLGLVTALRHYAERLAGASGLALHFSAGPLPKLTPEIDTTCFRIAQEALQNVVRHAAANNVWIDLRADGSQLRLSVRDDGRGCDVRAIRERVRQGETNGLQSMEERVELVAGKLEIESEPGSGMAVRVALPLRQESPRTVEIIP